MFSTKHSVCFCYVNKNVLINWKPLFDIKESQQNFDNDWYGVLYSATKPIFEEK